VNGFSSAISGVGSAIGRYFSLVSFIPSLFLVGFTFALIKSGAWSGNGSPDWVKAGDALTHLDNLVLLTLVSIALGVIVHPVQFALVQFFEGYWGTRWLPQQVRVARIQHYRNAKMRQVKAIVRATMALKNPKRPPGPDAMIALHSAVAEGERLLQGYPNDEVDIMPTRLGNVLRKYERQAGSQYGLEAIGITRHVALVAATHRLEYVNDQRQLLDLSVRMSATSIFATFVAVAFLWHHGLWLLIALVPYAIAYLSYRGAVVVAHEYGSALSTMIDLDRFALYEHLRLPRPLTTTSERRTNTQLMELIKHNPEVVLRYQHPAVTNSSGAEPQGR
jgi:hypothetical protein